MAYNYLREAESIRNADGCFYDSNSAYEVDWNTNGDVDGWDTFNFIHTYGVWSNVLFGTSYGGDPYFSRSAYFSPVAAEDYRILRIQMKISATRDGSHLSTGKVQWIKSGDLVWDDDKSLEFDITPDDKWRYYSIDLGPAQWWQGDIRNLRIFPFLNTRSGDKFFIRSISLTSPTEFSCTNPTCSFFSSYEHNCPGIGSRGYCLGTAVTGTVNIVEDVNDELIVNVDDYGDQTLKLTPSSGLSVIELARDIERQITKVDIGGYTTASAERDSNRIKINSGTLASDSTVVVKHSQLAEDLGFFLGAADISTKVTGTDPATGYEPEASFRLRGVEIQKITDSDTRETAFWHDPDRYEVEAGRVDWQQAVTGMLPQDVDYDWDEYDTVFDGEGTTVIDYTHPFNSDGRVTKVQVMGYPPDGETSKMKIFRPKMDGTLELVHEETFGAESGSYVYSTYKETFEINTDFRARKGDLVGFYNMNLYLGAVIGSVPDALLFYVQGDATGTFAPGELEGYGSFGLNFYARGDRRQNLAIIEIDLGDRVNTKSLLFYGEELSEDFEYNIAICEDINWRINLFNGTHTHAVADNVVPENSYTATHENRAYGTDLLGDGIKFSDGGLAGTSYGFDGGHGFYTVGTTYFYINGDAEWLNMDPGEDFGLPRYVGSPPTDFAHDPIEFKLIFPEEQVITRTALYFKERNNFHNFGWAYYLGDGTYLGNYSQDLRYKWVPEYSSVKVDNVYWTPETAPEEYGFYIFSNPTDAEWSTGSVVGDRTYVSADTQLAGYSLLWNVLEHEFDALTTRSFLFYTDYHSSTKMYEMEVYATVPNNPSLLDDVYVEHSREGDTWYTSVFEDVIIEGEEVAAAIIQENPRYIRLELTSSSIIKYREFVLLLEEDSVHVGDTHCQDELQMTTTKKGQANTAQYIDVWNDFDVPATLMVDIPLSDTKDTAILWSKLDSADDVTNPDIGPGGKYYKHPDYEIKNDDYQVAINDQCWALKNLAIDSEVYYQYHDFGWISAGTYSDGDSIDVAHPNKRTTRFSFTPISANYFKFMPKDFSMFGVSEMRVSYDGDDLDFTGYREGSIDPTTPLTNSYVELIDTDPTTGDYNVGDNYTVIDSFDGVAVNTSKWRVNNSQYLEVDGGELKTTFDAANQTCYVDSYLKWMLPYDRFWTCIINFEMDNFVAPTGSDHNIIKFETYDVQNSSWFIKIDRRINNSEDLLYYQYSASNGGGGSYEDAVAQGFDSDYTNLKFKMYHYSRDAMRARFESPSFSRNWDNSRWSSADVGWWFRIYFHTSQQAVTIPNFRVQVIYEEMANSEGVLGASFDSHTAIDTCRVFHNNAPDESGPAVYHSIEGDPNEAFDVTDEWGVDVYISYDNITYSYWDTAQVIFNNYNQEFETYVAVNLGLRRALEYIRTYGPTATDYDIANYTLYFNQDTDDVNELDPTGELVEFTYQGDYVGAAYCSTGCDPYFYTPTSDSTGLQFGGSTRYRAVGKFPTISIPTDIGAVLEYNLELRLSGRYGNNTNTEVRLQLYEALFDWPEDDTGNYWNPTQGVQIGTTLLGEVTYSDVFTNWPVEGDGWARIALNTAGQQLVDDWISGAKSNYGFYIMEWHDYVNEDVYPIESKVSWYNETHVDTSLHPRITITYRSSDVDTGSIDDVRWPVIIIPEGEAIGKIGIYPNTEIYLAPGGGYNCEWIDIGNILTDYSYKTNVATAGIISASSEYSEFKAGFVIDGVAPDGQIEKIWGSESETTPYLELIFDNIYDIDEIRCYWGYDTEDDRWLVTDYEIWAATSGTLDTFAGDNGDVPNTDKWEDVTQAEIYNNSLKIWSTASADGQVRLASTIGGNFSAFTTYSGTFPNTHDYNTVLRIEDPVSSGIVQIGRSYDNFTHFYHMQYYDGSWNTVDTVTTTDTSGKLKLERSGTVIYGYYWDDGWVELGTSTQVGASDVEASLRQDRWAFNPEVVSYFDYFAVYTDKVTSAVGNTDHNAVHSLDSVVSTQYALVQITGYDADEMVVADEANEIDFDIFEGAMCREIEFFETKGEAYVSNEDYPIVAIDLGYKFRVTAHDVTTPFPDYADSIWDNSNSQFRYSDAIEDEPYKVEFTAYGASLPRDARWVLVKDSDFISAGTVTYETDFSEYTLYSPPDDWYAHYPPGGYDWEVTDAEDNPLPASDRLLWIDCGPADDFRFVWETIPLTQDVEVVALLYTGYPVTDTASIVVRGSNTWDLGDQRGFMASFDSGSNAIRIARYKDGGYDTEDISFTYTASVEWYWLRFRLSGSNQYVKGWAYGTAEPGSWTGTWDKSDLNQSGWVGVLTYQNPEYVAYYSVGLGGSSAPHPDDADVNQIELDVAGGINFLDSVEVSSAHKYKITRFPWWWQSSYSTLSDNYTYIRPDSTASVQIDYTGTTEIDEIIFIEGANFGTDEEFSEMDYLSFWLYVPDTTKLDDYGEVVFGDYDSPRYHSWDISTTVSGFSTGWNEVEVKFRDADLKVNNQGDESITADFFDLNNYINLELKSFRLSLRGVGDPFTVYLDDIRIERNTFHDTVQHGKGLYLSHNEYAEWPLAEFDPHKGTLEFWMRPDYNFYGVDHFLQAKSRTIFSFTNVTNDIMSLFLKKGSGMALVTGNSEEMVVESSDPTAQSSFVNDDIVHVGFIWSNDGTAINSSGITAALFINGYWMAASFQTWEIRDKKSTRLIIGGAAPRQPALEDPTSCWASIDNLIVYNYCKRDFLDRYIEAPAYKELISPNEFIEISSDGVNFYNRDSANLPFTFNLVPAGESRRIWVRTNIPKNLSGAERRTASLKIEWLRSF